MNKVINGSPRNEGVKLEIIPIYLVGEKKTISSFYRKEIKFVDKKDDNGVGFLGIYEKLNGCTINKYGSR